MAAVARETDAAVRRGQAATVAIAESRAGGGQRHVEEAQGDEPDGLLEGARGQLAKATRSGGVLLLRLLRRDWLEIANGGH